MRMTPSVAGHPVAVERANPVERGPKRPPRRRVFRELADAVAVHMAIEERAKSRPAHERTGATLRKGKQFRTRVSVLRKLLADVPENAAHLFLDMARIMAEEATASFRSGLTIRNG